MVASAKSSMLAKMVKRAKARKRDPLRPLLDEYLLTREDSPTRFLRPPFDDLTERPRPPGRISPSSIGGCQKRAVFKFLGVKGFMKIDPDLQLIFDDGNWRHLKWGWTFYDMEAVLGKEKFEVISMEEDVSYDPLYVAGSLDTVVRINGKKWVVDFKGANLYTWTDAFMNNEPKVDHIWQLMLYMKARRIRRGLLMYENKNNQEVKVFVVEFNDDDWSEVVRWIKPVIKKLRERRLPQMDHECTKGSRMEQQCPFSKWCYGGDSHQVQERKAYKDFPGIDQQFERSFESV